MQSGAERRKQARGEEWPFIKCECLLNVDKNSKTQYQDSAKRSIVLHIKRKEGGQFRTGTEGMKGCTSKEGRDGGTGVGRRNERMQSNNLPESGAAR